MSNQAGTRITVRLPRAVRQAYEKRAKSEDRSLSKVIVRTLMEAAAKSAAK